jgi:predicted GIY-YIG superfamily endonuclease
MHFVYHLRSTSRPSKTYIGMTLLRSAPEAGLCFEGQAEEVPSRLQAHNDGLCPSTIRFRPWELVTYIAVQSEDQARKLEQYLKTGSGHAFAHKHLWT